MRKHAKRLMSLTLAAVMALTAAVGASATDGLVTLAGSSEMTLENMPSLTYEAVYKTMTALKSTYPEGMTWTNFTPYGRDGNLGDTYWFKGGAVKGARGGVGCAAFVFLLSDAAFEILPARTIDKGQFKFEDVKVGDILRVNNSHFVIVLQKSVGGVVIAEANYNKSVHWGRAMSVAEVEAANFLVTRYPENYIDPSEGNKDEVIQSGTERGLNWALTQGGMLTVTGTGPIQDYSPNDGQMPAWNAYSDKISGITIGSGVTGIGNYAFYQSKALSVYIPNTVTSIGQSAFYGSSLVAVTIPGSVQTIGDSAFRNCANLTSATISEGVKTVGQNAFRGCTAIGYMDFPSTITSLGAGAFMDCTSILQVRFAPGTAAVTIGDNLFTRCQRLMSVLLPEKADRISSGMFSNCNLLGELYIPAGVSSVMVIESGAVDGPFKQSGLTTINYGGSESDWNAKGGKQAILQTNGGGANITVNYNVPFNNPFEAIPNDPGDLVYDEHQHAWSEDWNRNASYHWHECGAENCPVTDNSQKDGYEAHSYGSWVTDTQATQTQPGSRHRDCTVCGYRQTETIPATGEPVKPEHTPENCPNKANLTPDQTCPVCGAAGTKAPAHSHTWSEDWTHDTDYHWHECSGEDCPVTDQDQKDGYGAHSYGDWITDTAATASQAGSKHRDCTVCGYRQTDSIPATGGSGSGSSGSGSSSSSSSGGGSHTNTRPGSSTTTTVTDPQTGTKTQTTKKADGSSVVVVTQTNGTVTTTATDTSGKTETEVKLSESAVDAARQNNQPVSLPIAAVKAAGEIAQAPVITVRTGKSDPVAIAIPVDSLSVSTVAVVVRADGSADVVKTSVQSGDSLIVPLENGAVVKIIENSKNFSDVPAGNWAEDAIAFASARELFAGTAENLFSPDSPMTRAMLMTVLASFDGADVAGGATWYEKSVEWAIERGISDGTNPNSNITREQLIMMLWRYWDSPTVSDALPEYADASQISSYAQEALQWGVKSGFINGFGDGRLGPHGEATRAQVAQILKNMIEHMMLDHV